MFILLTVFVVNKLYCKLCHRLTVESLSCKKFPDLKKTSICSGFKSQETRVLENAVAEDV